MSFAEVTSDDMSMVPEVWKQYKFVLRNLKGDLDIFTSKRFEVHTGNPIAKVDEGWYWECICVSDDKNFKGLIFGGHGPFKTILGAARNAVDFGQELVESGNLEFESALLEMVTQLEKADLDYGEFPWGP